MASLLDVVGAILISSLVLLALIGVMLFVQESERNTTMDNMVQTTTTNVAAIIENDFRKIGFNVPSGSPKVLSIDSTSISFRGDVDSSGTVDTVRYYLGTTVQSGSSANPDDRPLFRVVNGVTLKGAQFGCTYFNLTGYDSAGAVTTTASTVRSILVKMNVLSRESNNDRYAGTYWQARIRPMNLSIN